MREPLRGHPPWRRCASLRYAPGFKRPGCETPAGATIRYHRSDAPYQDGASTPKRWCEATGAFGGRTFSGDSRWVIAARRTSRPAIPDCSDLDPREGRSWPLRGNPDRKPEAGLVQIRCGPSEISNQAAAAKHQQCKREQNTRIFHDPRGLPRTILYGRRTPVQPEGRNKHPPRATRKLPVTLLEEFADLLPKTPREGLKSSLKLSSILYFKPFKVFGKFVKQGADWLK